MNYDSYAQLLSAQQQAFPNQALAANAAVEPDGIELKFEGDKCGRSYKIRPTSIKTWDSLFWDWHEGGWMEIRNHGGWHNRQEAIESCNKHAVETRLIKFLPHRQKFKATWGGLLGLASSVASVAAFGL